MPYTNEILGGYVRIIKGGDYEGIHYIPGEIWQIKDVFSEYCRVTRNDTEAVVSLESESKYGKEAEFIGMEQQSITNYAIY